MALRLLGQGILGSLLILMPSVDPDSYRVHLVLNYKKGKTTTTERMLYYSGHTRRIGSR